jgi:lipoprotein-anchoring transpeptidase ErfK/SrfK
MPGPLTLAAATVVAACLIAPAAVAGTPVPAPAAAQALVVLQAPHPVRTQPVPGAAQVAVVAARRPITGVRTVLPVLSRRTDDLGRAWLRVRLPGRTLTRRTPPPSGWVLARGTQAASTPWHVVVRLQGRVVEVFRAGRAVRSFRAVIGKPDTPTPAGAFFVEENVRLPAARSGGPFALALSARSAVLQEFDGGPGQIALHGLRHLGGRPGTAVSHGCVRLADSDITWLADRLGPGVPVTIR